MSDERSEPAMKRPQRAEDRVTINKEFDSFDAFVQEYVTNVSRTGVFVRSKSPLPVGSEVNLHFTVVTDEVQTIEGTGRVVRQEPGGMGVIFTEVNQYSQQLIERLLTRSGQ